MYDISASVSHCVGYVSLNFVKKWTADALSNLQFLFVCDAVLLAHHQISQMH